jgi:hypothetical protein
MTISTRWPRGTFCGPRAACKTHAATDLRLGRAWSRRLLNTPSHRRSTARKLSSACPKQREHVLPTSRNQHSAQCAVPRPSRRTTPDRHPSASTWIGPAATGIAACEGYKVRISRRRCFSQNPLIYYISMFIRRARAARQLFRLAFLASYFSKRDRILHSTLALGATRRRVVD